MSVDISSAIDKTFPDFQFRDGQRETIEEILNCYQSDPSTQILVDAPTGSGKSIISMFSSVILNKYFNKDGYILTADTSLQAQYERDSINLGFDMPSIMGMDNYNCSVNNRVVSMGDCRIKNHPISKIRSLDCYPTCKYYTKRDDAIESSTAILNYNYWLMQQTHVNATRPFEKQPFPIRDFTFFDEAHNVVNIVSNHFTPVIPLDLKDRVSNLLLYGVRTGTIKESDMFNIEKQLVDILTQMKKEKSNSKVLGLIKQLKPSFKILNNLKNELRSENEQLNRDGESLPDLNKNASRYLYTIGNMIKTIGNYHTMVKEDPENLIHKQYDETKNKIKLYCGDESKIMTRYFHKYHNFGVYLSATFLDMDFFYKYAGFDGSFKKIELPHTFNYKKSPIYFSDAYSMSYRDKASNIGPQIKAIDEIVDQYPSGVIHTASKANATELMKQSKHSGRKIRTYKNTKEKNILLNLLKNKKNFFIAGPSLLEGLDLKGDISRCQIFMKIPFPNLGDSFVKHRKDKDVSWYSWLTALNFVQGLGRSMRKQDDFCDTYILDSGFKRIANDGFLPYEVISRIKRYNH